MINVQLWYDDATVEERSFPENMIPRIGDSIRIDNIGYLVRNVMWNINPDPNTSTQIKCVYVFLKDLD